ncbi:hypothetical protein [Streptomyces fuscichromogenes]|uniref:Uncharacterized protein n=1 Tax=Streptomyces fuscichromogenes TaxID=1324013 RepID=A0A917XP73_9ACTN|nr:hypothetical protein [Streptomyces fuscichromogenes]GGN46128.1 hypothetical protein GCM10011578_098730 [Streptomyces fuscichromogenes]
MALPAVRTYLVINASAITRGLVVNGCRKRVVLHGYLVDDTRGRRVYAAELLDVYL